MSGEKPPIHRKMAIAAPKDEPHFAGESVWVEVLEEEPDTYILRNTPAHPDLLYGDVVHAIKVEVIEPAEDYSAMRATVVREMERHNANVDKAEALGNAEYIELIGPRETLDPIWDEITEPTVRHPLTFQHLVRRDYEIWHVEDAKCVYTATHNPSKDEDFASYPDRKLALIMTISNQDELDQRFQAFLDAFDPTSSPPRDATGVAGA